MRRRFAACCVLLVYVPLLMVPAVADPEPPGAERAPVTPLTGDEIATLRQLDSPFYRLRLQAARQLADLPDDRAVVVLTRALAANSERVRTAAAREAARRHPLPALAEPLLRLLREQVIDMDGACFRATRDAFFRLGGTAEAAFERACDNGLLVEAPELEGFFQRMAREALPAVIDGTREPAGGVLLMPWPGQFESVLKPEWIEILESLVMDGAVTLARVGFPALPFLTDAPPAIRRGALACFALAEWAERNPDHARRVRHTLRQACGIAPGFTPAVHWIRGPREQLAFALRAVLHRVGDPDGLRVIHEAAVVRMNALQTNHKREEVPRAWFMLRLHQALCGWWMGDIAGADRAFRDALTDVQLTAGSGVDRVVIAQAHVLWARVQATLRQAGHDGITADTICDALETAGEYGLRDTEWLQAITDFAPLHGTSRFRELIDRLATTADADAAAAERDDDSATDGGGGDEGGFDD